MEDNIKRSIFSLAKYNNGKFKSEKQAEFLKKMLRRNEGYLGSTDTFGNSTAFFAYWDDEGITKIDKHYGTSNRVKNFFTRYSEEEYEIEKARKLERLKNEYKELSKIWNDNLKSEIERIEKGVKALEKYLDGDDMMKKIYRDSVTVLDRYRRLNFLPDEMPDWWIHDKKRRYFYINGVQDAQESLKDGVPDFLLENIKIIISESLLNTFRI